MSMKQITLSENAKHAALSRWRNASDADRKKQGRKMLEGKRAKAKEKQNPLVGD